MKGMMRVVLATGALVLALAFTTAAMAGGKPSGYQGVAGGTQGLVQKGATKPTAVKTVGQLPFTGTDLGIFAAGAVALIGAGISFRRLGRRNA
jgi:hypothetical protein